MDDFFSSKKNEPLFRFFQEFFLWGEGGTSTCWMEKDSRKTLEFVMIRRVTLKTTVIAVGRFLELRKFVFANLPQKC